MTRGALAAASTFDAKISILKAIEAMNPNETPNSHPRHRGSRRAARAAMDRE
jgi:hypothetical protein